MSNDVVARFHHFQSLHEFGTRKVLFFIVLLLVGPLSVL